VVHGELELDVEPARTTGVIPTFLQPPDKGYPMVVTEDVGSTAAELFTERWTGGKIVELEGPAPVTPFEIGNTFGRLLGREVGWRWCHQESGMGSSAGWE
jgi:uncharacterized protein YbjT (DUF2867 family)